MDFFYDKQFRRYMQQFMRLFANFEIEIDRATETYRTVPVRYGDATRMASHILKQKSENVVNSAPFISCWIQSLEMDPESRKAPYETSKVQVFEKKFNTATNEYNNELGDAYQIERHMPVPYNLTMQVDIWTSNTEQKFQLLEQILTLYNPSVNLISSDNPFDWTRLSYAEMTSVQWSNRSIPTGVEDTIDIASLIFKMPIHLSVPSILSKQTLIHSIISNILSAKDSDEMNTFRSTGTIPNAPSSYLVTTYGSRGVRLSDTTLTLLTQSGSISSESWEDLFDERSGTLNTGVSKVKLMDASTESETNFQVYGTISLGGNVNELTVAIDTDTLPSDSTETPAVTAIIDPTVNYPGDGTLSAAADNQRYLLTSDLPVITEWGSLTGVKKNDIIEYSSSAWSVSFDASATSDLKFTTNTQDSKKYKWNGSNWSSAIERDYTSGYWRIYL